jgi:hypothetical protein
LCLKALIVLMCVGAAHAPAQDSDPSSPNLAQLNRELQQTHSELADSKRQIEQLRQSLEELRQQVQSGHPADSPAEASGEPPAATADQDADFLAAKVNELHQDKVESVSKYPVKLSGLVLFNSYWNKGIVDVQDLPSLALPPSLGEPSPGIGATLRQTILGVDVLGPKLIGAQTSADVEVDFAGGSPTTDFGVAAGLLRLRTAKVNLAWENTSLTIGQDSLFFSPLSPTSYATMLEPALSWSGNLWVWTPGVYATHRTALSDASSLVLQGGFLDPLTEGIPVFQGRDPTAGEATRVPAVAGRIAFERTKDVRLPFTIGFGGYHARQQYQTFPGIASWALTSDFKLGLGEHLQLSGEFYNGQAVGGLGGGIWASVVFPESDEPHSAIHPLRSTGGWGQLKLTPAPRFEINSVFGQDENYGQDLRVFPASFTYSGYPALQKNRTEFVNFIYKPTSVVLFALEYRRLFTVPAKATGQSADQINLAAGVRF